MKRKRTLGPVFLEVPWSPEQMRSMTLGVDMEIRGGGRTSAEEVDDVVMRGF